MADKISTTATYVGYRPAEDIARDLIRASSDPAVRRVQSWLADEREAGRCVFDVSDFWIARLLEVADGKA
jgi:hypothetical protein